MNVKAITIEGENVIIPASEYDRLCEVERARRNFTQVVICALHLVNNLAGSTAPPPFGLRALEQALKDAGYDV